MAWRDSSNGFGRQLAVAHETMLANLADPSHAIEPFETILVDLRDEPSDREEKLLRVRSLGRQLFAEIRSSSCRVAMEVRHYCWHLQRLGDPKESPASSVLDLLMVTLTRFAHYESHDPSCCSLCHEFRDDIPYQGSTGGRAHYHEWLRRRYGDEIVVVD
jgi:hypothetical protein